MSGSSRWRSVLLIFALLGVTTFSICRAQSPAPVKATEITEPRPFGYVIGDTLTRRIAIETERGVSLDADRLPKPGRVSGWLEMVDATHRSDNSGARARHEIALTYQIFNSAPEVTTRALPALRIPFKTAGGTVVHEVPQFLFTTGPLTPEYVAARGGLDEMRPDALPPLLSTAGVQARLALWGLGLAAIAGYFVYAYLGLPFLARSRGPFARALRAVRAVSRKGDSEQGLQPALKAMHRAFDETARGTVFGEHLDRFFAEHPRYAPLRGDVERFFAASQSAFFGTGSNGSTELSLPWLVNLCRALRDRERGVA